MVIRAKTLAMGYSGVRARSWKRRKRLPDPSISWRSWKAPEARGLNSLYRVCRGVRERRGVKRNIGREELKEKSDRGNDFVRPEHTTLKDG